MTSFRVDPPALLWFAALLGPHALSPEDQPRNWRQSSSYAGDVDAVWNYLDRHNTSGDLWDGWGHAGLLNQAKVKHEDNVGRARERIGLCKDTATKSSGSVWISARIYQTTDHQSAAAFDATIPSSEREAVRDRSQIDGATVAFNDIEDPQERLTDPDGGDLEPKANEIMTWVERLERWISLNTWARELLKKWLGRDPIEEIIEVFTGDWQELARWADMFRKCGGAFEGMHRNVEFCPDALTIFWQGNAADGAIAYFQRFAKATQAEIPYYRDYLFIIYREYMEVAYWAYRQIDRLVPDLLDLIPGLAVVKRIPVIGQILTLVKNIRKILEEALTLYDLIRMGRSRDDIPTEEPPCLMQELKVWDHPGADAWATS